MQNEKVLEGKEECFEFSVVGSLKIECLSASKEMDRKTAVKIDSWVEFISLKIGALKSK